MISPKVKSLTALLLATLASACTTQPQVHKYEQPAVQVTQTCPTLPPLSAELATPLNPDYILRIERLLTDYYKSRGTPMPPSATATP